LKAINAASKPTCTGGRWLLSRPKRLDLSCYWRRALRIASSLVMGSDHELEASTALDRWEWSDQPGWIESKAGAYLPDSGLRLRLSTQIATSRATWHSWPGKGCPGGRWHCRKTHTKATLTIRNLDVRTKAQLLIQTARHGRSMEEEARTILRAAIEHQSFRHPYPTASLMTPGRWGRQCSVTPEPP
jgi:plasmid stability protein